jgi:endo-alpha-1,4-polygalactosaminidase (GH114 family)
MKPIALLILLTLTAAPAWAEDAGLLAIPDRLNQIAPPEAGARPSDEPPPKLQLDTVPNFRAEMRDIVTELSTYAHNRNRDFVVLVRGGADLLVKAPREQWWEEQAEKPATLPVGALIRGYARALDGIILDGLYCADGKATAAEARKARLDQLRPLVELGRRIVSLDSCGDGDAVRLAAADKVLQYVATDKRLQAIPTRPPFENANPRITLGEARNLLVTLRSDAADSKVDWLARLRRTNHDILVIDAFHRGSEAVSKSEVETLKFKHLGTKRMVLAAMDLSQASEDRYYWKKEWQTGNPAYLVRRLGDSGEWQVSYWASDWKQVLGQYFKGLMDLGFDGVMLQGLDVFHALEADNPITDDERKAKAQAEKAAREKAKAEARAAAEKKQAEAAKPMIGEEVDPNKPANAEPPKPGAKPAATPAAGAAAADKKPAATPADKAKPPVPAKPGTQPPKPTPQATPPGVQPTSPGTQPPPPPGATPRKTAL